MVVPFAAAYLSVAPLHALLYDVVLYNAKYYRLGRGLPFPTLSFGPRFEDIVVYLLPIVLVLSLLVAVRSLSGRQTQDKKVVADSPIWVNVLIAFGVTAAVMYLKGIVRISAGQMYASIIPCVLLAAVLFQHREVLGVPLRSLYAITVVLFFWTAESAAQFKLFQGWHLQAIVINWLVTPTHQPPQPPFTSWCNEATPITRGLCFLLDGNRIQTVNYLDEHTGPEDYLYVGLSHHDRIRVGDSILYYAAQRIPAVHWTQFDPFLENRADIQLDMIRDLEKNRPPYIVLDSEFELTFEPNGSSISTHVHLLDDYISEHYVPVKSFGPMDILKNRALP